MNNIPREFTGKYIGEIGYDEEAGDLKITIKMEEVPESKEQQGEKKTAEEKSLEMKMMDAIEFVPFIDKDSETPYQDDYKGYAVACAKVAVEYAEQSLSSPKEEISYKPEFYEYMIKYYPHLCETEKDREISSLRRQLKEKQCGVYGTYSPQILESPEFKKSRSEVD